MGKSINLPSGATVELRDPREFKQKDRRKVYESISGDDSRTAGIAFMSGLIAIMVESWSLDLVPPSVKIESLDELSISDYDALQEHAEEAVKILFPSFGKDNDPDPKATAESSNA